ncbi:MAG: hypothetical protein JXA71_14515 [Chitinispirillaceae bacterium]|nr:hypothetical protein [Chitinispirillaceae bacterium]
MKSRNHRTTTRTLAFFPSLEDENTVERRRQARMSPQERLREVALLQERVWGKWTEKPMKRVISFERVTW